MSEIKPHWHCFCRVIDNFGDAGVALRFCRQLSIWQPYPVTLFIDDPALIQSLMDERDRLLFSVKAWSEIDVLTGAAAYVISLFGCGLPTRYIELAVKQFPHPQWINIEHLSAEDWIESFHLKPSPHPPLTEYFFYPGFTQRSGGLIHDTPKEKKLSVNPSLLPTSTAPKTLKIFLFCYQNAATFSLLESLSVSTTLCDVYIPRDLPHAQEIIQWMNSQKQSNSLTIHWLERMAQSAFDQVMLSCDVLFVRGEDTWARAQLMGKPLIWQCYPQEENVHLTKLTAFLQRYTQHFNSLSAKECMVDFHNKWNQGATIAHQDWENLHYHLPVLQQEAKTWQNLLLSQTDLIHQLLHFIEINNKI